MTAPFSCAKIQPSTGGAPGRVLRPKKSGRKPTSSMQHRRQKIRRTQQRVRRIPGNGRPAFFRFQAVRHTSPIVNRSTREVAFLWKALTENSDLTFLMDDLSSRLSASTVWSMAPATAGVQAMKTGNLSAFHLAGSGRINGMGPSGGSGSDANGGKALRTSRLMNRIFCHRFLPAESPPEGKNKPQAEGQARKPVVFSHRKAGKNLFPEL